MNKFVGLTFTLCFLLKCKGLKLALDNKFPASPAHRATCGVLLCVEESQASTDGTSRNVDVEDGFSPSQVVNITSLKVFKVESSPRNGEKRHSNLGTITSQLKRLAIVSDGVKVDGLLAAGRATLRLQLFKQEDCLAEFVCQSHGADSEGREVVSTSYLLQQQQQQASQTLGFRSNLPWTLGTTGLALDPISQLDSKLVVMGNAISNWEAEMKRFQDKIDQGVNSLKSDLNAKSDRLEDKLELLGKDLRAQANRLEDKFESLHKGSEGTANRYEDKLESLKTRLEDKLGSIGISKPCVLDSCSNDLKEIVKNHIRNGIASFSKEVSTVKDAIRDLGVDIRRQLHGLEEEIYLTVKNLTEIAKNENSKPGSKEALVTELGQNLTALERNLQSQLCELFSNITASITDTRVAVSGHESHCNFTAMGREIKSSLTELLAPTNCFKGMTSTVSLAHNMYSEIQASEENGLGAPVLCDIFTDGGGWIVIQRRVTGDVNFYLGWADYKQGFGDLHGDFWLGNDIIHAITSEGVYELRIDMRYNEKSAFAHYDSFSLGDERSNFALRVAHYSGDAGDSLLSHNSLGFSTHDRDNDIYSKSCAIEFVGAWWYGACHASNLNGQWKAGANKGPRWNTLSGAEPVTYTEMKIRRII